MEMAYSTRFGVLLLIAATLGEIYFEEDFEDDSWKERWLTTAYNGWTFGKFERSSVVFYGGVTNTGLGTTETSRPYNILTRFNSISIENKTLVLQFSVKYGRFSGCDFGKINLYGCNFPLSEMQWETPHVLEFGPVNCGGKQITLKAENLWGQRILSFTELPLDKHMHVYTLILRPNRSFEIIFDDETVHTESASLVKNQMHLLKQDQSRNIAKVYPEICGIGFSFFQSSGGSILFDNILLSDDVAVAKSKRSDILAQTTRWKLGVTSTLVDIAAEDLSKILYCKRNIQFKMDNTTHLIFEDFDKFLVPFNWNDNNTVILTTAEYSGLRGASSQSVKLWVSFQPQSEDILDDIYSVLKVVHEANSVAPKTVTTIVISYGFLKLDEQTVPFINHEIRKVKKRLKSLPFQGPDLGLQISDINCRSNRHYAQYLEANLLDFFVIMPMPQTKQFDGTDGNKMISSCAVSANLIDNMVVPPLIHSYESVEIDFEKEVYKYKKTFAEKYKNLYLHALALIRAGDKSRGEDIPDNEQVSKSKNLANWLYQPTDFSKSHLGAVISWKDIKLMGFQNFASLILEHSRHIMISISTHDDFETEDNFTAIVEEIARYSLLMTKQKSMGNHIPEDNTELQISILVTIESNDVEVNQRQADRAILAARKYNEISPGSIQIVFFDLLTCSQSEICSGHRKNSLEIVCLNAERVENLSHFLTHGRLSPVYWGKLKWEETLLGRVEDKWFDQLKLEYENKECVGGSGFGRFIQSSSLLCKTIMRYEDFANYGGLKASNIIIESFSFCAYIGKTDQYFAVYFYVDLVGCVGGHSNMTLLVEYALLMEYLNKWAQADEILLFINAGLEPSKCDAREKDCDCGWWIKQESSGSYQDKKSVARQLYEVAERTSITDGVKEITVVPPTALLWLWILIPVIIFGALITISAVFLIFYYRSKYILTKQEVDEFIKGRQTTRPEPVGEGGEAAEAQSYNNKKYELCPSTFTIDRTSKCLGSGEYGRVYSGSIRHDGELIKTAVKITNPSLVWKSYGYYLSLKGLLSEIKILAYVGEHNHIVSLLGAYTKNVRKGEIAVFLELCQLGSLDKYLHTIKPQLMDDYVASINETLDPEAIYVNEEENERGKIQVLDEESSEELFRWAREIASGMEFLVSKKLVHADLSTRNVLLTIDKVAKISDFGLSRRLYDYTEYVKQSQAPLPWRWMAPESLRRMIFNEKTDIWAFGVTLWEMFTLGDQPYPGLTWTGNFPALLERGLRLPEPRFNMKQIYLLMLRCWDISPPLRPAFTQLKSELNPI